MSNSHSASPLQPAYYAAPMEDFLQQSPQTILGHLAEHHAHDLDPAQRMAWLAQIDILKREMPVLPGSWLALEFAIPRMGKRADAIIVFDGVIFVVEFKIGAGEFSASAIDQAIDYALDLKNFHASSHEKPLVPLIVATSAKPKPAQTEFWPDYVHKPVLSNGTGLGQLIRTVAQDFTDRRPFQPHAWMTSGYRPTPTIIEAAQALYRSHRVEDITRSDASARNLSDTADCLSRIIEQAKARHHKAICFVTGVPGAGKTLAGLNLVTQRTKAHEEEHAVFLSGNGPLVDVLREALARDEKQRAAESRKPITLDDVRRRVKPFIQNIHHFRDANLASGDAPIERVAVFDEAQRAWDAKALSRFMAQKKGLLNFNTSEPELLIDVMDRHTDWCVIVCLIGGGQEINGGEAGLTDWFDALQRKHRDWKVYTSDQLDHPDYRWGRNLGAMLADSIHQTEPNLHLSVSIRSFRAEKLSAFINAVVAGNADEAKAIYREISPLYPMGLTRSLPQAKAWLRSHARGSERFGLAAYSGASRLKPEGINVHEKIDARYWFLNAKTDVRSSFYLEDPATEFDIQGLELDWVGVCWDANFRRLGNRWSHHIFHGTSWKTLGDSFRQAYLANAYRVLLTRARQGMVIYIPRGDERDPTRPPEVYDGIAAFLESCGLATIETER
jgi:hypothetical protein